MHLLYNGKSIPETELRLSINNRAFQYNDGFFETIIIIDGKIQHWEKHCLRIKEASTSLKLDSPECLTSTKFVADLLILAEKNFATEYSRIKLKVWRGGEGLYTPQTDAIEWLATVTPASPTLNHPLNIGICQNIRSVYSPLSHFKGPNAPIYILAGHEKNTLGLDDMLLLSPDLYMAELISSNIFWIKDNTINTPSLKTGCINGIMRRNIMEWCYQAGFQVEEVEREIADLDDAEAVFACNVTGIKRIQSVLGKPILNSSSILLALESFFNKPNKLG
jgi:branched-subunit amino acid aminotransferase/4-amino-4-deoxychorismate lyase